MSRPDTFMARRHRRPWTARLPWRARAAILVAILAAAEARAAERSRPPAPPARKTMGACAADIHKYCEAADLKQECLVAHWSKISSACQDVLATPARNGGGSGN